jgi:hypothetical protein
MHRWLTIVEDVERSSVAGSTGPSINLDVERMGYGPTCPFDRGADSPASSKVGAGPPPTPPESGEYGALVSLAASRLPPSR